MILSKEERIDLQLWFQRDIPKENRPTDKLLRNLEVLKYLKETKPELLHKDHNEKIEIMIEAYEIPLSITSSNYIEDIVFNNMFDHSDKVLRAVSDSTSRCFKIKSDITNFHVAAIDDIFNAYPKNKKSKSFDKYEIMLLVRGVEISYPKGKPTNHSESQREFFKYFVSKLLELDNDTIEFLKKKHEYINKHIGDWGK